MRLRPRPTVKETIPNYPDENVPLGGADLPHKAQKLLGAKVQVNVSNSKDHKQTDFTQLRKEEQKNLGTRFTAQRAPQIPLPTGISDMPSWSNLTASSSSSTDILHTPTASTGTLRLFPPNGSSMGVQTNQFYPTHQRSIESMNRDYYDRSKQPLHVSQQTSASAVRDMALRKGSPKVHEMGTDQITSVSALKPSNASVDTSKKPKRLDLSSLFPRPQASGGRLLSPAKYSHSPSAMTDRTEFFPPETMHAEIRRQGANGRFETHKSPKQPYSEPSNTPRVKIFEPDIYDSAKTNQRKPPKGIKNWFDGFDISSDEEEQEPVELPANPPRPSVEAIPSDFSPYGVRAPERAVPNGSPLMRTAQDNLHPMDPAKATMRRRMQSRSSESLTVTEDSSGGAGGHKRSGESRLAHSKLDSQSVLSLSSDSEEERDVVSQVRDSCYLMEDESTLGANLPSPVPRNRDTQPSVAQSVGLRISDSTAPTSGSIPIRLRDSTAAPIAVEDWADFAETKTVPSQPQQSPRSGVGAGAREARSRATTHSARDREGLKSAGGETSSSAPSDASRVMAVTEEEMMLLELMRKKRAAMQNNSFKEGYRLALKQEQDYLEKRRQSARNSVGKLLEEKAKKEGQSSPSHNGSDAIPENAARKDPSATNRYSMFRRQDVDKEFKIDRFLSTEAPPDEPPGEFYDEPDEEPRDEPTGEFYGEPDDEPRDEPQGEPYVAKMARMERFLMMKPSLADAIYDGRPVSGTEIETSTMTATEDEDAPSPMQRLAGIKREALRVSSPLADYEDENQEPEDSDVGYEEHHDRVRAFLQSNHASETAEFTALPQMLPVTQSENRRRRMGPLSPPIPEEELSTSDTRENRSDRKPGSREALTPRPPVTDSDEPALHPASTFQERSQWATAHDSPPTELPSARNGPSSISTGLTSPLSQSYSHSPPADNGVAEVPGSRSPSFVSTPHIAGRAKRISRLPTKIDTTASKNKTVGRITSMSSMSSAGEDVLAAWAELGGGSDALAARRRGR